MKTKKSTIAINMLILLAIGVFVFLILAYIVPNLIGKGSEETSVILSSSKDYDKDGIADYFDKCACDYGEEENDGCDAGHPDGYTEDEKTDCKNEIKGIT